MQRGFTNILSENVDRSAQFYETLLGLKRHFNSDWFVILTHPDKTGFEYGILQRDHEIVPPAIRSVPAGVLITFVVDDCDIIAARATEMGATIIQYPTDMPYGQRRMLLSDPDGAVLDISAPTAHTP